ncbi:MAG: Holliday junction ATP-dependent DNA helicase RuvB [Anaerolineales bacterium]|nr:Holliday junction ATP-dependent DNA helicase RuvB [Anaerolineales bacterium]
MSQALYRKYRPQGWAEVVGQQHVLQTLRNAIAADRVAHAYLFAGPRGTGKTTLARLLAKAVNCLNEDKSKRPCNECDYCRAVSENRFLDLIEIDAASNNGIEDVRELRDKINFAPTQGKYKIYIIDEVHMLSTPAFNALLKTLEEPPPHAIFVLATTEIHKIPATVLSRCQRHEFRRVPVDEIVANLQHIAAAENIQADDDALALIARQSAGGMRDAQSLLDQLSSTGERITMELAQTVLGTATSQTVLDLVASILDGEAARGLEAIHHALDGGVDPRSLARQIVDYLRGLMLIQMGNESQVETTKDIKAKMSAHASALTPADVLRMMRIFNEAATDSRGSWQPSLSLELAFAETLEAPAESAPVTRSTPKQSAKPSASQLTPVVVSTSSEKSGATAPTIPASEIIKVWKSFQAILKKESASNLAALLNSVTAIDVQGNTLVLGFASDVLMSKMKEEEKKRASQLIADALGVTLDIRCEVANARGKVPPHVPQDGMVATAIHQGGEIVDVQE